ncbi:MAG: ABC transporter ATP-binding protein [Candidatus Hodarchaeota archaeon]
MEAVMQETSIEIKGLKKHFGKIKAVDGVDLTIKKGELFSLLGPNGAGKTTLARMLTTVLTPTGGSATINGHDIGKGKDDVVKIIGVCPQEITIYDILTAEENVIFVAQMHGIPHKEAKKKAKELLKQFGIAGRKDRSKNFSGGMKRRLNLAMALVHEPEVLFLDEPTAGLDPQARRLVWDFIGGLKDLGITIVLLTHDMVEADALSDHVAIIDQGKIIAFGTPTELKEMHGSGNVLEISFKNEEDINMIKSQLQAIPSIDEWRENGNHSLYLSFKGGLKNFVNIMQHGGFEKIEEVEHMKFRQNSLEDVFLNITGRRLRDK